MLQQRPKKSLGQNFLVNRKIAEAEAAHAAGKIVLELGAGYGTLTSELCKKAKKVVAVEKDEGLFDTLKAELSAKNLKLIKGDFFDVESEIEKEHVDIMIANIPYNLSSRVIGWLEQHSLPAVLCLQKEFVEHMTAKPDTSKYSKLSVIAALEFRIVKIMDVSKGNFNPVPKVDSAIVLIEPSGRKVSEEENRLISMLMQHKKKKLRNAIYDSRKELGLSDEMARSIAEATEHNADRVFKLEPAVLLKIADWLMAEMGKMHIQNE